MEQKRIIVCDDDEGVLEFTELILNFFGYEVIREEKSINLIPLIQKIQPDLLILDLWMPVLSGDQLVKIIRNTENIKDLPILVFSASGDGAAISSQCGANDFIQKPFDVDTLNQKIHKLLVEHLV